MWPVSGLMISAVGCGARGGVAVRSNSIAVGIGSEPTSGVQAPARPADDAITATIHVRDPGLSIWGALLQRGWLRAHKLLITWARVGLTHTAAAAGSNRRAGRDGKSAFCSG